VNLLIHVVKLKICTVSSANETVLLISLTKNKILSINKPLRKRFREQYLNTFNSFVKVTVQY
jgi:hypothetical protein